MISFSGLGGYGAQGSDPNLPDKIAALKRSRKSPEDTLREFLERDIGVDPRTLAFTHRQALEHLRDVLEVNETDEVQLFGNSLGFSRAVFHGYDTPAITITSDEPGEYDWHDLERAYTALTKAHGKCRFDVALAYPEVDVTPLDPAPVRQRDPSKYPSGALLRLTHSSGRREYVRIGGLLDDTTPTIVDTLQPIGDLTGWSVTEELTT